MRIACLGNMNNNMFCLVRYLRQRGYDAHLLLLSEEQQNFLPKTDTYDENYGEYTHQLQWGSESDFDKTCPRKLLADLSGYDAFIACNYAPAFLHKAGIVVDIFCPHGSDYYEVPFYTTLNGHPTPLAIAQRQAIVNARYIMAVHSNPIREQYWTTLAPRGVRVPHPIPLIFTPEYTEEKMDRHQIDDATREAMLNIKSRHDMVVMQHSRQCWGNPTLANDYKGNDILVRGFGAFTQEWGGKAALVLLNYGPDVQRTKALVTELGLAQHVHWLPQTTRKRLMPLVRLADISALEFHFSWIAGGALYEALALARPVLAKRDDHEYPGTRLFPMLQASTQQEVMARLLDFAQAPEHFASLGEEGRLWLHIEVIDPALNAVTAILDGDGPGAALRNGWSFFPTNNTQYVN